MLIPLAVLMIPQFLMFHLIGWYGTYLPLIVPSFAGNAFYIFSFASICAASVPSSRRGADRRLQLLGYLLAHHSAADAPVLAVVVVFAFLGSWNDLLGPLIYLDNNNKFTMAIGLANLVTCANPKLNLLMAANLITIIPVTIVYFFAQDKLIGGISSVGL